MKEKDHVRVGWWDGRQRRRRQQQQWKVGRNCQCIQKLRPQGALMNLVCCGGVKLTGGLGRFDWLNLPEDGLAEQQRGANQVTPYRPPVRPPAPGDTRLPKQWKGQPATFHQHLQMTAEPLNLNSLDC
jgi:hypothetical protein